MITTRSYLRTILGLTILSSAIGCQNSYGPFAPAPSQIPPPPTGTVGQANGYYSRDTRVGGLTPSDVPRTARANEPRARFSSETQRSRAQQNRHAPLDTSLDTSLDAAPSLRDQSKYSNDLEWRSPVHDIVATPDVMTANFEDSRPRPRFTR